MLNGVRNMQVFKFNVESLVEAFGTLRSIRDTQGDKLLSYQV